MRDAPESPQADDRRSLFAATLLLLCITALSVAAGVLPTAIRPPEGLFGEMNKELAVAAASIAVPAVPLAGVSAWGVWRRARWGEALGVITLVGVAVGAAAALVWLFR